MFVTSIGFSVDIHYCKNEIQSVSFIGKAKSCKELGKHQCGSHHNSLEQSCHSSFDSSTCAKDCCHNEKFSQDNLKGKSLNSSVDFTELVVPHFLFAFVHVFILSATSHFHSATLFEHYKPPLLARNIQSLFQVFLI